MYTVYFKLEHACCCCSSSSPSSSHVTVLFIVSYCSLHCFFLVSHSFSSCDFVVSRLFIPSMESEFHKQIFKLLALIFVGMYMCICSYTERCTVTSACHIYTESKYMVRLVRLPVFNTSMCDIGPSFGKSSVRAR